MHLIVDKDFDLRRRIWMKIGSLCSVGLMEVSITREIIHNIIVVNQKYTELRSHRQW